METIMNCQLCAASKSIDEQVDLLSETEKRNEIIHKLLRINAPIDFVHYKSPAMVCLHCLNSLTKAYDFVVGIENAQKVLGNILNQANVKIEMMDEEEYRGNHEAPLNSQSSEDDETSIARELTRDKKKTLLELPLERQTQKWVEFTWHCSYCECTFPLLDELQAHSMADHSCCNAYHCTDCNFQTGILDKFLDHLKKHHLLLPYSCYRCFDKFITIKDERKHEKIHIETEYYCPGCNKSFLNQEELSRHQQPYFKVKAKSTMPKYKEYKCDICSKVLKRPKGLIAHKLLHMRGEASYKCEVCGKGFFDRYKLARHGIAHSDHRPYKCDKCDMSFKTNPQLIKHATKHSDEKPFACDECGQCFRHSNLLSAHKKVHTDLKLNECPHCGKCFKYRRALNVHIGTHKELNEYILPIEPEVTINEENE